MTNENNSKASKKEFLERILELHKKIWMEETTSDSHKPIQNLWNSYSSEQRIESVISAIQESDT